METFSIRTTHNSRLHEIINDKGDTVAMIEVGYDIRYRLTSALPPRENLLDDDFSFHSLYRAFNYFVDNLSGLKCLSIGIKPPKQDNFDKFRADAAASAMSGWLSGFDGNELPDSEQVASFSVECADALMKKLGMAPNNSIPSDRVAKALHGLFIQALQSNVNDPSNEYGQEAMTEATMVLQALGLLKAGVE